MPAKKENPLDPTIIEQLVETFIQKYDEQVSKFIAEKLNNIETKIDEVKDDQNAAEMKINKKLEAVDMALRGNGRVGIFEQLRNIRTSQKVIYTCVLLLFGLKVWGVGFDEWFHGMFKNNQKTTITQRHSPTTQESTQEHGDF